MMATLVEKETDATARLVHVHHNHDGEKPLLFQYLFYLKPNVLKRRRVPSQY